MTIIVSQFGFTPASGALANLVDGDLTTFWQPLPDGFDGYPDVPVADGGFVLPGSPRPALQFDFINAVRIPMFRVTVGTPAALGWTWLLASDNTATSVDDTVQSGDIYAGRYTVAQINSGLALATFAQTQNIRKRFWRFVFFKNPAGGDVNNWPITDPPLGPQHGNTYGP